jgi:hypothetical protein
MENEQLIPLAVNYECLLENTNCHSRDQLNSLNNRNSIEMSQMANKIIKNV